jgi:hypothetical protein
MGKSLLRRGGLGLFDLAAKKLASRTTRLDRFEVDALNGSECCRSVPQIVESMCRDLGILEDALKSLGEVSACGRHIHRSAEFLFY